MRLFADADFPFLDWRYKAYGISAAVLLLGLIAIIVLGLAAIVFGAIRDRRLNERRRREMLAPPQRDIPRFSPDTPQPAYLSELQAHRPPADATPRPVRRSSGDSVPTWAGSGRTPTGRWSPRWSTSTRRASRRTRRRSSASGSSTRPRSVTPSTTPKKRCRSASTSPGRSPPSGQGNCSGSMRRRHASAGIRHFSGAVGL